MWLSLKAVARDPTDDFWFGPAGMMTAAGAAVSPESALRLSIVYACVKVLAETVAHVPLILYRRMERGKERATEHPLYRLIRRPNEWQTGFEWREMKQGHLGLRGNAYSEILYRGSKVAGLRPLHPDSVKPQEMNGSWRYLVKDGTQERVLVRDEILHLRGLSSHGLIGLNPIEVEREAIGFGLAAQEHGARFYQNGAVFPGWLEHPAYFKNPEDRDKFRASWQAMQTGANRFKTPVLEYGMKYHEIPIKHTDAQYLETRKYQNEDVARIFRMPPHKVGILERSTNNNIEQQAIEFVTDTMMPWFKRWEERLTESLLTEQEQEEYFFEFLVDGLLRGDSNARAIFYNKGIQDGWLVRNEVRELENRNPLPGLDEPLEPLNMTRAGDRGRRQEDNRDSAMRVAAAERVVRKEAIALEKAYQRCLSRPDDYRKFVKDFYTEHALYVMEAMLTTRPVAGRWCDEQHERMTQAIDKEIASNDPTVLVMLESWLPSRARDLAALTETENG